MNVVPALGLIFDPTHESPDVIDQRSPNDPTRQQTGGNVPIDPTPGDVLPVAHDPRVTIFNGWNVWDVYQSQAPIDPTPGTLDQQLKAWVIDAANAPPDTQVALVSPSAIGSLAQSRSTLDDVGDLPLTLGTGGSAVLKRTVAFHYALDRLTRPWPFDQNYILDATYLPAPAPVLPSPAPTQGPSTPAPSSSAPPAPAQHGSGGGLMLALGIGIGAVLLFRARGRR